MGLPIPAMLTDKFCGFLELDMGLRVLSLVYLGFWVSNGKRLQMS